MIEQLSNENFQNFYLPLKNPFDLSGKSYIVFGGSSGIGLGIALGLASAGAKVIINGRNEEKLQNAVEMAALAGLTLIPLSGSISDPRFTEKLELNFKELIGDNLSGIIVSAAIFYSNESLTYPIDKISDILDTNLKAPFILSQWAANHMKLNGGTILFISSGSSIRSFPRYPIYSASKAGVNALARTLAVEWARYNIRVNTIIAGWIDTPMTSFTHDNSDLNVSTYEKIKKTIPARRWGKPKDFSSLAIWIMSESSNYISGSEIIVDGGLFAS